MAYQVKDDIIGFIGLGTMGCSMVKRLVNSGRSICLFARNPASAHGLIGKNISLQKNVAELAKSCRKIFTIVGGPSDVEELYCGSDGLIAHAAAGSILVDMTTSSPELAKSLHQQGSKRDIRILDAPVTGGATGAINGSLTFMVGGDADILEAVRPELSTMGKMIFHTGSAGSGQSAKMCNQLAVAGILTGIAEALACAKISALEPEQILEILKTGTAESALLPRIGKKMLDGDNIASFMINHFIKDLDIAIKSGEAGGVILSGAKETQRRYQEIADDYGGEYGIQALINCYLSDANKTINK